jgi:uncharacterized protein (TIGR03083 family)
MRVDKDFVFAAVADERRRIAALIEGLDDAQLATESLCTGWDVKTVAAHLVSVFADGFWGFQAAAVRHGGIHRGIDALARRRGADHRLSPPVTGPVSGLTDVLVHGGDIRIPLGIPFYPDLQLVTLALDFLTGGRALAFVPFGRLRGIGLRASDVDRSWGSGAGVRGPAAALMMAACGRDALLDRLDGPGSALLRDRLTVFRDRS